MCVLVVRHQCHERSACQETDQPEGACPNGTLEGSSMGVNDIAGPGQNAIEEANGNSHVRRALHQDQLGAVTPQEKDSSKTPEQVSQRKTQQALSVQKIDEMEFLNLQFVGQNPAPRSPARRSPHEKQSANVLE